MNSSDKLYVLIRKDIPTGSQIAQSVHGMRQFSHEHPDLDHQWFHGSNTVVVLHVRDAMHLRKLHDKALPGGISGSVFFEPDLGDQPTCLVLAPMVQTRKLTSGLSLAR